MYVSVCICICSVWNVRGFLDNSNLRRNIIDYMNLDIIILCETFLKNKEIITLPGYNWIGHNRTNLSKRAVRGSGGVGVLVDNTLLNTYTVSVLDNEYEGILWISLTNIDSSESICLCACTHGL